METYSVLLMLVLCKIIAMLSQRNTESLNVHVCRILRENRTNCHKSTSNGERVMCYSYQNCQDPPTEQESELSCEGSLPKGNFSNAFAITVGIYSPVVPIGRLSLFIGF